MPASHTSYHADLSAIGASAIDEMTTRSRAREEALSISRQVIRFSANAIRAVHRGEFEEAQNLIQPVFILLIVPLVAMFPVAQEPNGTVARKTATCA